MFMFLDRSFLIKITIVFRIVFIYCSRDTYFLGIKSVDDLYCGRSYVAVVIVTAEASGAIPRPILTYHHVRNFMRSPWHSVYKKAINIQNSRPIE